MTHVNVLGRPLMNAEDKRRKTQELTEDEVVPEKSSRSKMNKVI
jgi:hypothetical protein